MSLLEKTVERAMAAEALVIDLYVTERSRRFYKQQVEGHFAVMECVNRNPGFKGEPPPRCFNYVYRKTESWCAACKLGVEIIGCYTSAKAAKKEVLEKLHAHAAKVCADLLATKQGRAI